MAPQRIGFLHPGDMGISLAASAQNGGNAVFWASEGRSPDTRARAAKYELRDAQTLAQLCAECAIVVSVCPPHAAEQVAQQVRAAGFGGLYVDANAIAPERAERIAADMAAAGVGFVDGGIIGGPAWAPGSTWLYLAGPQADLVAACFAAGPLETQVLGAEIGRASALKMCYAAYTKGTTALLAAILAAAEALGVRANLEQHWQRDEPQFAADVTRRVRQATAKAWRFAGEMEEIADTFRAAGLPGEFHAAAADVYRRLADFKAARATPDLEDVLAALLRPGRESVENQEPRTENQTL
jgi:3-hydroxyisobutyrate dehydrogenase-like beta-hydroxyacid dehydrogenase